MNNVPLSKTTSVGFAVMGCGRIAKRHTTLLSNGSVAGAKLVAVCDPITEKQEEFSKEFSVPGYNSIDELLKNHDEDIEVVCVLTESGYHAQHSVQVAKAGKHVVVEKPMALTLDDADMMIEACDAAGVRLFVVKQNRYNAPVRLARKAFEKGYFGKIVMGTVRVRWRRDQYYYDQDAWRGTWSLDGGVFANQASHHVDLLQWFLGNPMNVYAKSRAALADIECDDTGTAIIEFQNGALGLVEATTAARPKNLEGSLSIMGEKGTVVIGGFAVNKLETWEFEDQEAMDMLSASGEHNDNPPDVYGFGHQLYLNNVVDSIRGNGVFLVDGLEGRRSLELVSAIYESIETRQEVPLRYRQRQSRLGRR